MTKKWLWQAKIVLYLAVIGAAFKIPYPWSVWQAAIGGLALGCTIMGLVRIYAVTPSRLSVYESAIMPPVTIKVEMPPGATVPAPYVK